MSSEVEDVSEGANVAVIAGLIDDVLGAVGKPNEADVIAATKAKVVALMGRFPLPYKL